MTDTASRTIRKQRKALNYRIKQIIYGGDALARDDENPDREFYSEERMVSHIDDTARAGVEHVVDSMIPTGATILDLMASWDSHIPETVRPERVVGLGLNRIELEANPVLDEWLVHDLNEEPRLPFADASFDVVLNTVSVEYLTQPFKVFREVARILRPGGLLLVIISDRMFRSKAVKAWIQASEQERVMMVEDFMADCRLFETPRTWVSKGLPRPEGDKYAEISPFSDPVIAIISERIGVDGAEKPLPPPLVAENFSPEEIRKRTAQVAETRCCPHCDSRLASWEVPQTPYTTWDAEHLYVCPNNQCPYMLRAWAALSAQGVSGSGYRLMYDPVRDRCGALPITNLEDFGA